MRNLCVLHVLFDLPDCDFLGIETCSNVEGQLLNGVWLACLIAILRYYCNPVGWIGINLETKWDANIKKDFMTKDYKDLIIQNWIRITKSDRPGQLSIWTFAFCQTVRYDLVRVVMLWLKDLVARHLLGPLQLHMKSKLYTKLRPLLHIKHIVCLLERPA